MFIAAVLNFVVGENTNNGEKHNFFADLATALPDNFTRNGDNVHNEKDEQIAALQVEVLWLQQDKELLIELARKG